MPIFFDDHVRRHASSKPNRPGLTCRCSPTANFHASNAVSFPAAVTPCLVPGIETTRTQRVRDNANAAASAQAHPRRREGTKLERSSAAGMGPFPKDRQLLCQHHRPPGRHLPILGQARHQRRHRRRRRLLAVPLVRGPLCCNLCLPKLKAMRVQH